MAKPLLVGVSGGIAAYKVPALLRDLMRLGYAPRCILTKHATQFVSPLALAAITGEQVWTDEDLESGRISHVEMARYADTFLVVPATANGMAKFANGIADEILSSTYLMFRGSFIWVPAMHEEMWEHEATQKNVEILSRRHGAPVGPVSGALCLGDIGKGRMSHEDMIITAVALSGKGALTQLVDKKLTVVLGPCSEPIDTVRTITNRSSGALGIAIAKVAQIYGAKVTVISSVSVSEDYGFESIRNFTSYSDLSEELLVKGVDYDVLYMAAAVSDFVPSPSTEKWERSDQSRAVELAPTQDILAALGEKKAESQSLIGFCLAESEGLVATAKSKLQKKNCDYIVANTAESIGAEQRTVHIVSKSGKLESVEQASVIDAAYRILAGTLGG